MPGRDRSGDARNPRGTHAGRGYPDPMILMGGHVDQADPIAEAQARGATLSQFFLGDPQGWKGPKVAYAGGAAALRANAEAAGIALYVHAPYVLNVATSNNRIRIPSRQHLQKQLTAAAEIGAAGVIVHGGHVGADEDADLGFANWFKCVDGLDIAVPLLIENTAGGANAMARRLERIDRLWSAIGPSANADKVGLLELAEGAGLATGVVSSARLTHATPAAPSWKPAPLA